MATMTLSASQLRHSIVIEQATITRNDTGEEVPGPWTTFATCRAAVMPQKGQQTIAADRIFTYSPTVFIVRFRSGITPKMRVRWGSRIYRIESTRSLNEEKRDLRIEAVETFQEAVL